MLPAVFGPPVESFPQRSAQIAGRCHLNREACRRDRQWRDGDAGERRRSRRWAGEGATVACSVAASQLVRLSSGFNMSPAECRPVQRTSTYGRPGPAKVHLDFEQFLHLVLRHAVRASRWRW